MALALFAAAAFGVEAESAGAIAAALGFARFGEHLANLVEHAGIRGRVAARRAADRRLIDLDQLVDLVHAAEAGVRARLRAGAAQAPADRAGQRLVQQRAFARSAHARDAHQQTDRKLHADILEIVGRGSFERDRARFGDAPPLGGNGNLQPAGKISAGERIGRFAHFARRALRDDPPAVQPGAGADVDQMIGLQHHRLIVLDHQHGVALRLQLTQGVDQPLVVARVQADRRLVEHVAHADQPGADRRGQADALQLAAAERVGRAIEREIIEADLAEEVQPVADFVGQRLIDGQIVGMDFDRGEELRRPHGAAWP